MKTNLLATFGPTLSHPTYLGMLCQHNKQLCQILKLKIAHFVNKTLKFIIFGSKTDPSSNSVTTHWTFIAKIWSFSQLPLYCVLYTWVLTMNRWDRFHPTWAFIWGCYSLASLDQPRRPHTWLNQESGQWLANELFLVAFVLVIQWFYNTCDWGLQDCHYGGSCPWPRRPPQDFGLLEKIKNSSHSPELYLCTYYYSKKLTKNVEFLSPRKLLKNVLSTRGKKFKWLNNSFLLAVRREP